MTTYRVPQSLVDADIARLGEAASHAKATGRATPETLSAPFAPVTVDFPKVSDHWRREQAEYGKRGPRWTTPRYQAATSKNPERAPDFHHKAAHILRGQGYSGPATAKVLGISLSTARKYLARPCPALEVERREITQRHRVEAYECTKRGKAPVDAWAYLGEAEAPFVSDQLGFDPWGKERDAGTTTAERIAFFHMDGGWTQQEIANLVGVDRSTVSKHIKRLKEMASLKARKAAAIGKQRNNRSVILTYKLAY